MNATRATRLASVPLLRALPPDRLEHVIHGCTVRHASRGRILLERGRPTDTLFLIERGTISIARLPGHGRAGILELLGPGELFGEDILLGHAPGHDAIAVADVTAIGIPAEPITSLAASDPAVAIAVADLFGSRMRRLEQIAADLLLLDATGRLASRLCRLADRHGRASPEGPKLPWSVTHDHLAGLVGVSRETVSRALSSCQAAGWLRWHRGQPVITDLAALRDRART